MSISFQEARTAVVGEIADQLAKGAAGLREERVALDEAVGRVLAQDVRADRDQPPFDRSTRDGFAVRTADVAHASAEHPATLTIVGEIPPGTELAGQIVQGQCAEIMTGAPLPPGADAVVMVEHTTPGEGATVLIQRAVSTSDNVVARGSELAAAAVAVPAGRRISVAAVGLLASLGCGSPTVFRRPRVAILPTGDELVDVDETPRPAQIRNSNRHSLAAQVQSAGGVPLAGAIVRDNARELEARLERALAEADILLLTGGVSAGKYDLVESVLQRMGARIVFDGVAIRPGRPLVFGLVRGRPFFGLPGNPLSTMVTFDLFVRPALDLLCGAEPRPFRLSHVRLGEDYQQRKVPLLAFVPARLSGEGRDVTVHALPSQGSGDLAAMARADCLLVVEPGVTALRAGDLVPVF